MDISDRELLELAAKAAGMKATGWFYLGEDHETGFQGLVIESLDKRWWNPLRYDGDALRLAVKLGIDVDHLDMEVFAVKGNIVAIEPNGDPYAATRRAIVRAAAELGKSMKGES